MLRFFPTYPALMALVGSGMLLAQEPLVAFAWTDPCVVVGKTALLDGRDSRAPNQHTRDIWWTQESGPAVTIIDHKKPVASFQAKEAGIYTFKLSVRDGTQTDTQLIQIAAVVGGTAINGDFRRVDQAGLPEAWQIDKSITGASIRIEAPENTGNGAALRIDLPGNRPVPETKDPEFIRVSQNIQLEPYRAYQLKAQIRGRDVQQGFWNDLSPERVGPSIGVDLWLGDSFRNTELNNRLTGTFGWQDIAFEFPTDGTGRTSLRLQAGHGQPGAATAASGTVWFRNVRVEPVLDHIPVVGRYSVRFFRQDVFAALGQAKASEYTDELDSYYRVLSDLSGKGLAFKQVFFHPWTWDIYAGAWSGNLSLISSDPLASWKTGRLRREHFLEGEIHEMCHNLEVPPLWGEMAPGTMAYYAVRELNLRVGDLRGEDAVAAYHQYVHQIGQEEWDTNQRVNQNRLQDKFMLIAKEIGWARAFDAFKQVFRMVLIAQEPGNPKARLWKPGYDFPEQLYTQEFIAAMKSNQWQQLKKFFDTASRIADFDRWSVFSKEEIAALKKRLKKNDLGD